MGTTRLSRRPSAAVRNDEATEVERLGLDPVEIVERDAQDGPRPWWSALIWLTLLLVGLAFYAALIYAVVAYLF